MESALAGVVVKEAGGHRVAVDGRDCVPSRGQAQRVPSPAGTEVKKALPRRPAGQGEDGTHLEIGYRVVEFGEMHGEVFLAEVVVGPRVGCHVRTLARLAPPGQGGGMGDDVQCAQRQKARQLRR